MGNSPKVERREPYPVVLSLNPNLSEGTKMLVSNIFLEFSLLKSVKKRHYDRPELSQLVRSRNWHSKQLPIIIHIDQLSDHRLEARFQEEGVFEEFRRFVVYEFSFLAVPTGTWLATLERVGPGRSTSVRKIKVRSYCDVHRKAGSGYKTSPQSKRQTGAVLMHVDYPSSPDPSVPPAFYTVPKSKASAYN